MDKNLFVTDTWANWFKIHFFLFYKRSSSRVEVFRDFLQKGQFFLKKIDCFKESDRAFVLFWHVYTICFDFFRFFYIKILVVTLFFVYRWHIRICFLFDFGLYLLSFHPFHFFLYLSVLYVRALPYYCRTNHSFESRSGRRPYTPKSTTMNIE